MQRPERINGPSSIAPWSTHLDRLKVELQKKATEKDENAYVYYEIINNGGAAIFYIHGSHGDPETFVIQEGFGRQLVAQQVRVG